MVGAFGNNSYCKVKWPPCQDTNFLNVVTHAISSVKFQESEWSVAKRRLLKFRRSVSGGEAMGKCLAGVVTTVLCVWPLCVVQLDKIADSVA